MVFAQCGLCALFLPDVVYAAPSERPDADPYTPVWRRVVSCWLLWAFRHGLVWLGEFVWWSRVVSVGRGRLGA